MGKIVFFLFRLLFYVQFLIAGFFLQFFIFKPKYYYEDDTRQNKWFKDGVVIISNHRSFLDGLVIALKYFPKVYHYISENFFTQRFKIVKHIVNATGGIFLEKGLPDFEFIEESKSVMKKGRPVTIFPEGGFQYSYEPAKFYPGYILLAVNTGAKIIPVVNDFGYGLFKRVHLLIGNSIDLSEYSNTELTREKRKEINKEIYDKYMMLFYQLKRKKAEKFSFEYNDIPPKPGAVIRIPAGPNHHYGVYLNDNEVIQFGHAENNEEAIVNSVSLKEFCNGSGNSSSTQEVRITKKRHTRKLADIEKYARSCLGQGRYNTEKNNCLDFVNRVTLKI